MCFAYWRTPLGKRAALAVAVTLTGAFLLLSSVDADARSRKRLRATGAWQAGFAAIVIDAKTGKTLDEENPDALRHPASLTKIMTLYMLFERIEQGKLSLKSQLKVSEYASEQPPSKLGVHEGQTISVEDAIKALVTRSANDVAVVIAEALAEDVEAFAVQMTRKARALGMNNTTFKNASGLPDREQVTTARDMATLGRAIQDRFPALYGFFSTQSFTYKGRVIANHNRLLGRVPGVDGIKTGYTNASGFNLVTSVRHKGRHVVAVVLGGRTGAARDQYMRELIADNLDDATPGPRTAPLVAEAPPPAPPRQVKAAKAPPVKEVEKKQVAARAPQAKAQPKQQPVIVAGSNAPIRPIPVKTLTFDAQGKIVQQAPAQEGLSFSNFSTANVIAVPMMQGSGQPVIIADAAPQMQPQIEQQVQQQVQHQARAQNSAPSALAGALAFASDRPHPLAENLKLEPQQTSAPQSPRVLSETEELELEAQAIAAERKEDALVPVAQKQQTQRRAQVASTNSIPVATNRLNDAANGQDDDTLPPAAKTGWSIQIGAFPNEKSAKDRLEEVKGSATALLAKVVPYTERVSKDSSNLFRAKFAGFKSEWHARRTCQTLLRKDVDCIVAKN